MYTNNSYFAIDEEFQMKQTYHVNRRKDQVYYDFDLISEILLVEKLASFQLSFIVQLKAQWKKKP